MQRDIERITRIREALETAGLDVVVCTLPENVLLLCGYWPVVGASLALATRDGRVIVLVPEDEDQMAARGWADELQTFKTGSLAELIDTMDAIHTPLAEVAKQLGAKIRIGYESGNTFEPFSYVGMHLYGASIWEVLGAAFPAATLLPADDLLACLKAEKTPNEVAHIRNSCNAAARAFTEGARQLRPGLSEFEAAAHFRNALSSEVTSSDGSERADGFVFCMSGPNSAEACRAYAQSRGRTLATGDFVLVHCNSYVGGFWTDITRTYCLGEPSQRQAEMYAAVLAASAAAIATIRPGVYGHEVDRAARDVLTQRGFGDGFKHSTGHGVGFAAIDHHARPRLHPKSDDRLETGMVFNVEPAIYVQGYGGIRHCDMVAVTELGADVLTPFQTNVQELTIL